MLIRSNESKLRWAAVLGAIGLICCCGIIPRPLQAQDHVPVRDWSPGDTVRFGIGKYVTLLAEDRGWFLWERATPQVKECMAFKVADDFQWPRFSELGRPTGSAGYWFSWDTLMPKYKFGGFFGRHWHPRIQVAEVDGVVRTDYHSSEAVQSWDGKKVRFEITTTPYQHIWANRHEDRGVIDFTGIGAIMEEFEKCKVRLGSDFRKR